MKWLTLAQFLVPIVTMAIPGAAPLTSPILAALHEAQQLHGDDGPAKRQHVFNVVADGAAAANASGKVTIDPAQALTVTAAVFEAIDGVHAVVRDNQAAATAP